MDEREKRVDSISQVIALFQQLSPEDQGIVFTNLVSKMETDSDTSSELLPPPFVVSRGHLEQSLALTTENIDVLTNDDLAEISRRMHTHYLNELFWDELAFYTMELLEEKNGSPASK